LPFHCELSIERADLDLGNIRGEGRGVFLDELLGRLNLLLASEKCKDVSRKRLLEVDFEDAFQEGVLNVGDWPRLMNYLDRELAAFYSKHLNAL